MTSACFKQRGNSPLIRDWLKFWNSNLEKMTSFIFINVTGISLSRQAFFSIKSFDYIFHFVYWNRLGTERENIFWFHNGFDISYTRMILILKWCFFYWILDVSCFSYLTLILYYVWALYYVDFYVLLFWGGDFGKADLRTVTTSLWNSDKLVSNSWVSRKLLIVLVRNKSVQEGLGLGLGF